MNITIKESMLFRKCLNDYVIDNNLDYEDSPLFNNLMHRLKDYENDISLSIGYNKTKGMFKDRNHPLFNKRVSIVDLQVEAKNDKRNEVYKELRKYSIQTTCNNKIVEIDKEEKRTTCNVCKKLFKGVGYYKANNICNLCDEHKKRTTPFKATIKEIKTIDHRKEKKAITQEIVNDIVSKLNLDVANKINERERKREGKEAMKSLIKLNLNKKGDK